MLSSAPLSPKFHGAYLGAGSAAAISNVIIGLVWPHGSAPAAYVQLIYAGVGVLLAGFGAWIMPSGKQPVAQVTVTATPPGQPPVDAAAERIRKVVAGDA